ncbi:MspA family porin [Gordonia araii]|uniref:MspA family porin n=1 Tax=Gordonia araii TaxID=263909 RepID=UPI001FE0A933|nr:MspA family porin [Gordonia araii]
MTLALPNGTQRGDGVTIVKTRERARVGPSMAANGAGRSVWVSGDVRVLAPGIDTRRAGPFNFPRGEDAMPGSNGTSSTGAAASLSIGYVVGCQVEIGAMQAGLGGSISVVTILDSFGGSFSLPLAPGRIIYAQIERKQLTKPGTYYFNWRNSQMDIQGCGGYAQARSRVTLEVTGSDHQKITLWGRPFSIG